MKKTGWLAIVFGALVLGYVVFSSFRSRAFHCRVCMSFNGATDCRRASADSREGALRAAITNACAQLASGVTDSMRCERTEPQSVEWN